MVVSQRDSLLAYLALHDDLSGHLLLIHGAEEAAAAVGGMALGAAVLLIEKDPNAARALLRQGVCDFVVATLDEAVRILKNEVRKKAPVCVVLIDSASSADAELHERGIVADRVWQASMLQDREVICDVAYTLRDRRDHDEILMMNGTGERWLLAAARYFPREMERWLQANDAESSTSPSPSCGPIAH